MEDKLKLSLFIAGGMAKDVKLWSQVNTLDHKVGASCYGQQKYKVIGEGFLHILEPPHDPMIRLIFHERETNLFLV